ncbi:MAG: response regulator, partial [Methylotenera sp.]
MKIIVTESDDSSRQLLETALSAEGYEVVSFDDGLKALAYLQSETVDLIISDILMPEMDGYGLCRAVKQNQNLKKIPFIFYTATYTSSQDERFAISLGANKFLIKPMEMPDLLKIIAEVITSGQKVSGSKNRGTSRSSPIKLDKQHVDIVPTKLDQKLLELNEEKQKLIESEARFRDFAEASS